jgi:hypothetical protein
VSEQNESGLRRLLFGADHSEGEQKVVDYVSHRLKEGANLSEVLEEEYVVRNITPAQRDEIRTNPTIVQEYREGGLEQDYESEELKPQEPPRH